MEGKIILQVGESYGFEYENFLLLEAQLENQFKHKPRFTLVLTAVICNGLQFCNL